MPGRQWDAATVQPLDVQWRVLRGVAGLPHSSKALFEGLYGRAGGTDTFWLDR